MQDNRRDRMQIIADVLRLKEGTKTEIMYSLGFSSGRAGDYIDFLVKKGFLERVNIGPRTIYQTSASGKHFLEQMDRLTHLLE